MRQFRGFRIGHKLVKVFKWGVNRRNGFHHHPRRLKGPSCTTKVMTKLCNWGRSLCFGKPSSGYIRVGEDPVDKPESVPQGHLAVYVGDREDDDLRRVLVPVFYFNHPLFGELLREAEKVYGFNHPGGIQLPCRISEFENVQTKIAATGGGDCRRRRIWGSSRVK